MSEKGAKEDEFMKNKTVEYAVIHGPSAGDRDLETIVRLVKSGGAVDEHFVRQGIRRAGAKVVLARIDNEMIGVAALKMPAASYRSGLGSAAKSGHPIPPDQFPFELGYVAVSSRYEGRGIARTLIGKVIEQADGHGLFATTFNAAMKDTLLPRAGFERVGTSWLNDENERLHLYTLNQ